MGVDQLDVSLLLQSAVAVKVESEESQIRHTRPVAFGIDRSGRNGIL